MMDLGRTSVSGTPLPGPEDFAGPGCTPTATWSDIAAALSPLLLHNSDPVLPPDPNGAKSGTSFTATAASLSALGPAKPRVSQGDQGAHKLPGQVKAALPPPPPPPSGHTRATRQQWRQGMMDNLISTQGRPATTSRVPLR